MYYKRSTGAILARKSADIPDWVQWPHHPFCHCTLESVDYAVVLSNVTVASAYGKYDPFLFNTNGKYTHGKEDLMKLWGFSVDDIPWLKAEIERQAHGKYLSGNYLLGKLDVHGQHVNIRAAIPHKDTGEIVTFITGWMARPNGHLQMATPYVDD